MAITPTVINGYDNQAVRAMISQPVSQDLVDYLRRDCEAVKAMSHNFDMLGMNLASAMDFTWESNYSQQAQIQFEQMKFEIEEQANKVYLDQQTEELFGGIDYIENPYGMASILETSPLNQYYYMANPMVIRGVNECRFEGIPNTIMQPDYLPENNSLYLDVTDSLAEFEEDGVVIRCNVHADDTPTLTSFDRLKVLAQWSHAEFLSDLGIDPTNPDSILDAVKEN